MRFNATKILWLIMVASFLLMAVSYYWVVSRPLSTLRTPGAPIPLTETFAYEVFVLQLGGVGAFGCVGSLVVLAIRERNQKRGARGFPLD